MTWAQALQRPLILDDHSNWGRYSRCVCVEIRESQIISYSTIEYLMLNVHPWFCKQPRNVCLYISFKYWWESLDSINTENKCLAVICLSSPSLKGLTLQRTKLVLLVWPSQVSYCFLSGDFISLEKYQLSNHQGLWLNGLVKFTNSRWKRDFCRFDFPHFDHACNQILTNSLEKISPNASFF